MTSLEIAERTGKRHNNVTRDIKNLFTVGIDFKEEQYTNKRNKVYPMYLLTPQCAELLMTKYSLNVNGGKKYEIGALKAVETILYIKLQWQFKVNCCGGIYYIDGYDKENNIAYEIDEPHHKTNQEEDKKREEEIKKVLGCKFVRIKI